MYTIVNTEGAVIAPGHSSESEARAKLHDMVADGVLESGLYFVAIDVPPKEKAE